MFWKWHLSVCAEEPHVGLQLSLTEDVLYESCAYQRWNTVKGVSNLLYAFYVESKSELSAATSCGDAMA